MFTILHQRAQLPGRRSLVSMAVASALLLSCASSYAENHPENVIKGIVAGSYFTAPVNSDNPAESTASSTVASVYKGAKVCVDSNDNGLCDKGEASTTTKKDGSFVLNSHKSGPLVAEISTQATNAGKPVTQRNVFRAAAEQIADSNEHEHHGGDMGKEHRESHGPQSVAVTPLSTEVVRMMEDQHADFTAMRKNLAKRLGVPANQVLDDPNTVNDTAIQTALLNESVILSERFALAAKMVDRGDVSPAALAANPSATGPTTTIKEAEQTVMNIEGIPRYDHIFIIMLENKGTKSIKDSPYAPKINAYLNEGNQFTNYFATGRPSEPNYLALGAADDFGINDDSQWNCDATDANAVQDLPLPDNSQPGLENSPFKATCTQASGINHNIIGRPNMFNALTSAGMTWRTYNESMNPGQDVRTDSVADAAVTATDNVYAPGTLNGNTDAIGDANLVLPLPAGLYKTKHHPGMGFQNVRSAAEFKTSNRTMGGGQWDAAMLNSSDYAIPAGYDLDQFGADLRTGDIGNLNFVIPDQCDDMHGITVKGTDTATGATVTASDCGGNNIITRGDNYVDSVIKKIQASPIWKNPAKRVAIVIMFDEGKGTYNATTNPYNGCCGWNPANSTVANPLVQNADGTFSVDSSIYNYAKGNTGHGESIFGLLTNQPNAPKGQVDSDAYSHFSFVRTLQDMFGLADPGNDGSYMNRSKYTEQFISANILNLPEYASSTDLHFDSVRPMNHAYVIPADYVAKQSTADIDTPPQVGPDANQINLWALK